MPAVVEEHEQGTNNFSYSGNFGDFKFRPADNSYFLEDKLEFID